MSYLLVEYVCYHACFYYIWSKINRNDENSFTQMSSYINYPHLLVYTCLTTSTSTASWADQRASVWLSVCLFKYWGETLLLNQVVYVSVWLVTYLHPLELCAWSLLVLLLSTTQNIILVLLKTIITWNRRNVFLCTLK